MASPLGVFRGFVRGASKRPLTAKIGPIGYVKGHGAKATGKHTSKGGYEVDPNKVIDMVVPNLDGFMLKPYVSRTTRPRGLKAPKPEDFLKTLWFELAEVKAQRVAEQHRIAKTKVQDLQQAIDKLKAKEPLVQETIQSAKKTADELAAFAAVAEAEALKEATEAAVNAEFDALRAADDLTALKESLRSNISELALAEKQVLALAEQAAIEEEKMAAAKLKKAEEIKAQEEKKAAEAAEKAEQEKKAQEKRAEEAKAAQEAAEAIARAKKVVDNEERINADKTEAAAETEEKAPQKKTKKPTRRGGAPKSK